MHIAGPFFDRSRRSSPKKWFLVYFAAERPGEKKRRLRPYYPTKEQANADRQRIRDQYESAGNVGSSGILSRAQVEDYEQAKRDAPEATVAEMAKFWRMHHPRLAAKKIRELTPGFLDWVKSRLGQTRHYDDLKSRIGPVNDRATGQPRDSAFLTAFGERLPVTVAREEFLTWLLGLGKGGRTVLNAKRAVVNFFNYLVDEAKVLDKNQLAGIKKRALPKSVAKEIRFLSLVDVNRYLRAAERYDPDLVAHEIIQLVAGVRADDEMEDFRGEWVMPATRQVLIPAEIAKTEKREVIDRLEENFWAWWKAYGREGLLRVKNYEQRWRRVRVLAAVADRHQVDELARLPVKTLLQRPESAAALRAWPWNARRRTFCTYHVAKHQSAARTALILRHRGEATTLHNSYRGTGVTKSQGGDYFAIMPHPVARPIRPSRPARGIIRLQFERAKIEIPPLAASA